MYHFHEYTTLWTKHIHRLGSHHHPGPRLLPPLSTAGAGERGPARPLQEAATKQLCFPRWNTDNTLTSISPANSARGITTCLSPHHLTLHWILKDPSLGGAEAAGGRHRDPAPSRAELRPLVHAVSSRPASGCAAPSLINLGCYAHLPGLSQGR